MIKLSTAQCVIITAGAGMGVDSGLPDFRGNQGFWNAHKAFDQKYSFTDCANPRFLKEHPDLFWGFYGNRFNMYLRTQPHKGFYNLLEKCKDKPTFVITSNVDGHFQKAGFQNVYEVHGTINYNQCDICQILMPGREVTVNLTNFEASDLPKCSKCSAIVRPNILMFNDYDWISDRTDTQRQAFMEFVNQHKNKQTAIIEIGAGSVVPTIRNISSELLYVFKKSHLYRVNVTESAVDDIRATEIKSTALEALSNIF